MYIKRSLFFLLLIIFSGQLSALDMVEGEWELVVKENVSGMPIGIPPAHYRECFTEADPIPTSYLEARNCDIIEQHVVHRTVHYKINCLTKNGPVINIGKIHFGSRKITGSSKTDLGDVAGKTTVLRYRFTGRRIGACQ
jgi:hypothetical protein